jgi:hypothetical protein
VQALQRVCVFGWCDLVTGHPVVVGPEGQSHSYTRGATRGSSAATGLASAASR